ncbi:phosphate ABC transporter permease PstA [Motilibacter deserti]|uniref:Phosphate transport system permease protein PstA n=1 Tax=Motilibacter deserti TaxID=2714956 RepID=A0ABX0GYQ1_9ACTN|nr:phosphate ABC transporter permease PstA [Motilibacter deserti]NHC14835.1 phosphate ABC transporter permease PstA [Motilibacter deserti]
MSTTLLPTNEPTREPESRSLLPETRPLPGWMPWALAVAAVGLSVLLLLALGSLNLPLAVVVSVPIFAALVGLASARLEGTRRAKDRIVTVVVYTCFALAILPLLSVLITTIQRGASHLTPYFLTHSQRGIGPRDEGGGIYHGIIGTFEQVGIAALIAVPIGLLVAVYLVEYGRGALARAVTFFVDVMTGVPSIVAGLFVYTAILLGFGTTPKGVWGGLALSILMLPVVVRSTEEMLKLVPNDLREASLALGVPKWKTIVSIVMPTAIGGIVTGVMLSVARVIGETAPLVLTVGATDSINFNAFDGPQASLPLIIYDQAFRSSPYAQDRAWATALTLILLVLILNLVARGIARWKAPKAR